MIFSKQIFLKFCPILTGILLAVSFPNCNLSFFAWTALIPLLLSISRANSNSQAIKVGFVSGVIFFILSMHWLTQITFFGWLFVSAVEALYFMAFSFLSYRVIKSQLSVIFKIIWLASVWTVLEFIRSEIPVVGLGWNLIAYSQTQYLPIIQSANLFGVYGLGFFIVLVNGCLFFAFQDLKKIRQNLRYFLFAAAIVLSLVYYGQTVLSEKVSPNEYLRVSVLQGNIPQAVKWQVMAKEKIIEVYEKLSQLAALDQTDLIIWPEASFPGYFNRDMQAEKIYRLAEQEKTPMLIGGLHWESETKLYNSAYFITKNGTALSRYDKLRLVPFGEYIPFKFLFGWLAPVADAFGISDFSAGKSAEVFRWAREEWPFGVLICFEDVFPDLARDLANKGARFLTVITNDAWFGETGAPFQHLQASIFRAVENGLPVVRAANTGVSAFISKYGRVMGAVQNGSGKAIFVAGKKTMDLPLNIDATFYRRGGYLFPYFVMLILIIGTVFLRRQE